MKVTGSSIEQLEKDKTRARCRKWRLWASTEQGRKSKRFTGTYTAACDAISAWVAELEAKVPNAETFAAYAESWRLWREKSGDVKPGTVKGDKTDVRALSASPLGGMRMDELTPEACRDALLWVKQHPLGKEGGELSGATMRKRHATLALITAQAHRDGKIAKDPMESVKRPKCDTKERDALDPEELSSFIAKVDSLPLDQFSMCLYLISFLGLRRAEACALKDSDVQDGFVRVAGTVVECTSSIEEPKTDAGARTLPMPGKLSEKVGEWRAIRAARGLSGAETLCCNTVGNTLHPNSLYRWWMDKRDSLGCSGMTLHQLRHSNLSMMARHMSPFDLQRYAGWASLAPALTYVHDNLDAVSEAVDSAWTSIEGESSAPNLHQRRRRPRLITP